MTPALHGLPPIRTAWGEAALKALSTSGVALVACQGGTEGEWAASIVAMMRPIAAQIRVFANLPDWRTIGVNLAKEPDRSEGAGESPLHMDFVNAEYPPDFVVLICVRPDPLGGGQSTLASMVDAIAVLSPEDRQLLAVPQFVDGKVKGLENVGKDVNPFPVLGSGGHFQFRYTAQLLEGKYPGETGVALRRLHAELESRRATCLVPTGHALIIDQHHHVHGKLPLGESQETLPTAQRRMLLHGFFRSVRHT